MASPPSIFEEAHPADQVAQLGNYLQPNLNYGLRIWWAFYWPTTLATVVLLIGVNVTIRAILEIPTLSFTLSRFLVLLAKYDLYIISYVVAFFVIAYILRKNFRDFRIGLLSNYGGEGAESLKPTFRRTARIWWTFSWRTVVYKTIALVAASVAMGFVRGLLSALLPAALINVIVQVVLDAVIGAFVIYSNILDEDISDFRVALLPRVVTTASAGAPAAAPNVVGTTTAH